MEEPSNEKARPASANRLALSAWCVVAAFGTYFCAYAFRKPFTAGLYHDISLGGVGFKTILVTAQVLGYTLSKFLGIKVIAEVKPHRRVVLLLSLIAAAESALLMFGLTPAPYNAVWLFINGVPLGMVFGLVLGFLEGRRQTEVLTAGLCASFIAADGVTKSAGAFMLQAGVSEYWMPFAAGLLFVPPLLFFVWMLTRIPHPSTQDVADRNERRPLVRGERRQLFRRYATGLTLLVLVYLLMTVLRSLRADFAPEIWAGLQASVPSDVFARSETVVAVGVLLLTAATVLFQNHRRAFFVALGLAFLGAILIAAALLGLNARMVSPLAFMVLIGLGLYLPYIVIHTTLFERLMAATRERGNIGYLLYLADSFGYLGYVAVLIARNLLAPRENFLSFFVLIGWATAGACVLLLVPCWFYFAIHPALRSSGECAFQGTAWAAEKGV
jgi:hypothetical protein